MTVDLAKAQKFSTFESSVANLEYQRGDVIKRVTQPSYYRHYGSSIRRKLVLILAVVKTRPGDKWQYLYRELDGDSHIPAAELNEDKEWTPLKLRFKSNQVYRYRNAVNADNTSDFTKVAHIHESRMPEGDIDDYVAGTVGTVGIRRADNLPDDAIDLRKLSNEHIGEAFRIFSVAFNGRVPNENTFRKNVADVLALYSKDGGLPPFDISNSYTFVSSIVDQRLRNANECVVYMSDWISKFRT